MDPTQGEKQNDQTQQKQSGQGIISHGINSINNLRGAKSLLSNPINKAGSRIALQAGRSLITFLATNPWAWGILLILVAVIFTFVIVMGLGGAPTSETNTQGSNLNPTATQSATPTETIVTPTPLAAP